MTVKRFSNQELDEKVLATGEYQITPQASTLVQESLAHGFVFSPFIRCNISYDNESWQDINRLYNSDTNQSMLVYAVPDKTNIHFMSRGIITGVSTIYFKYWLYATGIN